ncbi:hypothetical protein F3Y22_tig00116958pilonHSYRG00029 [Hibiscus syriacus]|uniref:ENTH domain-containing protein n=1 Tax=Hibiscus syriacus TaxID=106335 RepID=A0A6A2WKE9_HIBSY|nr:hypothetical protein F3Y22_tig00116958pilonHSYRG00029 [Hibiscus syriacus]
MGTLLLNKIKEQASCFLQEKYRDARIAFTDVTAAELLTEDATNNDPWGPDVRTMTKISETSFNMEDYWRIVHIIHRRFDWGLNMQKRSDNVLELLQGAQDIIHDLHLMDDLESPILVKSEDDSYFEDKDLQFPSSEDESLKCLHLWDCPPIPEKGSLLESDYHRGEKNFPKSSDGFIVEICSKLGISSSKNDAANVIRNKFGRHLSLRF